MLARRQWIGIAFLSALLVGAGAAGLLWSQPWLYRHLAERQGEKLRSERPEQRAAACERLRDLGVYGIDVLVAALADDNPAVAQDAEQTIDRALNDWQHEPPDVADRNIARLARALALQVEAIPPERRAAAARWTQQILVWPIDGPSVDVGQILADCRTIASESSGERVQKLLAAAELRPSDPVVAATRPFVADDKSNTPEEGLSPEPLDIPELALTTPAPDPSTAPEPLPTLAPKSSGVDAENGEPQRFFTPNARRLDPPTQRRPRRVARPTEQTHPVDPFAWLRQETDFEVMRRLHATDEKLIEAAQQELTRRGYRERDFVLCRTLVHPDPEQRKIFAAALPRMVGIDARPWLLQLSEDRDPEVRRTATAILRTSQDPALLRRLE